MNIVAVVTARGGSKSIPKKNIASVGGKPLIAWSIEAARGCPRVDRTIVSTDSAEIADVARRFGAEVPFLRPDELAGDATPHIDAIEHALSWLEADQGYRPDYILLLQPTSPLRTSDDVTAAISLLDGVRPPGVVGVCSAENHPFLTKRIGPDGALVNFVESEIKYLRRQDLPPAYVINGAIYLTRSDVLLAERTFCPHGAIPYVMSRERSIDIDEPWDLEVADLALRRTPAAAA